MATKRKAEDFLDEQPTAESFLNQAPNAESFLDEKKTSLFDRLPDDLKRRLQDYAAAGGAAAGELAQAFPLPLVQEGGTALRTLAQKIAPNNPNVVEKFAAGLYDTPETRQYFEDKFGPTESDILKKAEKEGKVPFGDIGRKYAAHIASQLVPLTPVQTYYAAGLLEGPLSEIAGAAKEFATTKNVNMTIPHETLKDFYTFGSEKLDPHTFEILKKVPPDELKELLKAGGDINLRMKVPRFGGKPGVTPLETGTSVSQSNSAPASGRTELEPIGQAPPVQAGISPSGLKSADQIFPATEISAQPSIAQHPDFVKVSNEAASVVNRYAQERKAPATRDFAQQIHDELHDALGQVLSAPPDQKLAVAQQITSKYPNIEKDFASLSHKLWTDKNEAYFKRYVAQTPEVKPLPPALPPSGVAALVKEFPSLAMEVTKIAAQSHPEHLQNAIVEAVAQAEAAKINGASPPQAEQDAIAHLRGKLRLGEIASLGASPPQSKAVKVDQHGIPIRKPGSVVSQVDVGGGKQIKVTHQMVLDEAQNLREQALEQRGKAGELEKLVGHRLQIPQGEAEEWRQVPVRFKGGTSTPDALAHEAFDQGLLEEPSSELLRSELLAIPTRGKEPKLAEFYAQAHRNLEYYAQEGVNPLALQHPPDEEFGGVANEYSVEPQDATKQIQQQGKSAAEQILKANKIDDRVVVNLVRHIENDDVAFQTGRGRQFKANEEQIVGRTVTSGRGDRLQAVIDLAENATTRTGRHEAFHAVTNMVLSDSDKAILLNRYKNMEAAADAFSDFQGGKNTKNSLLDRIFSKIKEFLDKFMNALKGHGFKSAEDIFTAVDEGKLGEEAKTALNPQTDYSTRQNTFFSQVERTIAERMPAKASPEQIMGLLKNSPGIKQEELDWLGLDDFLKGKTSVSKGDLQKFVAENNVQIKEVLKGDKSSDLVRRFTMQIEDKGYHVIDAPGIAGEDGFEIEKDGVTLQDEDLPPDVRKLSEFLQKALNKEGTADTKFHKYTLPGGENYRELLLTLPAEKIVPTADEMAEHAKLKIRSDLTQVEKNRLSELDKLMSGRREAEKTSFQSSHFPEPNILAHVRFNDRTDAEGNKVLFLEEIQSDWHQMGREKGYQQPPATKYSFAQGKFGEDDHQWFVDMPDGKRFSVGKGIVDGKVEAEDYLERLIETRNVEAERKDYSAVPDAPFKKTWPELALKRMLRFAAENGYDKIAWTTGEQQAERYDLSKQIDEVQYGKLPGETDKYFVVAKKDGETLTKNNYLSKDELPGFIGKEIAQKIINDEGKKIGDAHTPENYRSLSGLDLKVGGEGMKGFYDQIIPQFLNKYTKKWGGRVGETEVVSKLGGEKSQFAERKEKVHSLDITPSMKESVMQGQPQFSVENKEEEFFKNRPFELQRKENDKLTARGIRQQFSGIKNEQIVRGNQFADEIKRVVPSELERQGMFWYKAANGNLNDLAAALDDSKLAAYHPQIEAAMKLSPQALQMLQKVGRYYEQAGAVSKEVGTIGNVLDNYQNRLYLPEKPQDFVKTEVRSGIRQTTRHAKQRVFKTELDAARYGKRFATTDIADALSIHNEEMSRVNTARKMAESMVGEGLAAWKREIPENWSKIGNLEKRVRIKDKDGNAVIGEDGNQVVATSYLVAPKGIAKGLSAIADPNFAKKIDTLRNLQRYQGLVKTVDLSFSFFHHFSMVMQMLYQGDFSALTKLPTLNKILASSEFNSLERDFVLHSGMTSKVQANQDILRNLVQNTGDTFSKIVNLPILRNVLRTADRGADFLFGRIQRMMKVHNYGAKIADWAVDHPTSTNEQVIEAKRGIARHINSVYGGLNWEAMGMTQSNLSLLRLAMLAPDWTISNVQLLTQIFEGKGTAGSASRRHVLSALMLGMVLTEGLNKLLTGHFTDKNKSGHKLEVEFSPNVYLSFFRGGIGDIVKFGSMVAESGLPGISRFSQGKLAPLPRTAIGWLTNTQYTGRPISKKNEGPFKGTYDTLLYLLSSATPMPLGFSNFLQYASSRQPTLSGSIAVLTGVGRFSRGPKKAYRG